MPEVAEGERVEVTVSPAKAPEKPPRSVIDFILDPDRPVRDAADWEEREREIRDIRDSRDR